MKLKTHTHSLNEIIYNCRGNIENEYRWILCIQINNLEGFY